MVAPALWVPLTGPVFVKLPYTPVRHANRHWLQREIGGDATPRVKYLGSGLWQMARGYSDDIAAHLIARFGPERVTIIHDVPENDQQACSAPCQAAQVTTALECVCRCGGVTHAGARLGGAAWVEDYSYDLSPDVRRVRVTPSALWY